jgi:hypothetical protein
MNGTQAPNPRSPRNLVAFRGPDTHHTRNASIRQIHAVEVGATEALGRAEVRAAFAKLGIEIYMNAAELGKFLRSQALRLSSLLAHRGW